MNDNLPTSEEKEFLTQELTKLENELKVLIDEETKKSNEFKKKWQTLAEQPKRVFKECNIEDVCALANQLESENKTYTIFVNRPNLFPDKSFEKSFEETRSTLNSRTVTLEHIENKLKNGNDFTNFLLKSYQVDAVTQEKYCKMIEKIADIKQQLDSTSILQPVKNIDIAVSNTNFVDNKNSSKTAEGKNSNSETVENAVPHITVIENEENFAKNLVPVTKIVESKNSTLENLVSVTNVVESDNVMENLVPVTHITETNLNHMDKQEIFEKVVDKQKNGTKLTNSVSAAGNTNYSATTSSFSPIIKKLIADSNAHYAPWTQTDTISKAKIPVSQNKTMLFTPEQYQTYGNEQFPYVLKAKQAPTSTEMNWDLFDATDNIPQTLSAPTTTTFEEIRFFDNQKYKINFDKIDVPTVNASKNDNENVSAVTNYNILPSIKLHFNSCK